MTAGFTQFPLRPELAQAVADLGFTVPTPIQIAAIPPMLAGRDIIGQAQTGTGKTAAFGLPALHNLEPGMNRPQCIVITPTRELALQVATALESYGVHMGARVLAIYGGSSYGRQKSMLRSGVDIVVGTPGRLIDLIGQGSLKLDAIRTLILDEADEMLSMGFLEDIEAILQHTPPERQTTLFSATIPSEIRRLAGQYLRDPEWIAIERQKKTTEAIEERYYMVNPDERTAALTRLFEVENISRGLIFTRTRVSSSELANALTVRGFPAEALNGELSQESRERVMDRFRNDQLKVLVATDVAARGLDIDDISHVFNYDLPLETEIYVHRIGRTGRAGKTGVAISLVSPSELPRLNRIENYTRRRLTQAEIPTEEEITIHRDSQMLIQMAVWLKRGRAKRERAMVEELLAEGYDLESIASAALKLARAEEKQRPIDTITPLHMPMRRDRNRSDRRTGRSEMRMPEGRQRDNGRERTSRPSRGDWSDRPERGSARSGDAPRRQEGSREERSRVGGSSHETGMVRMMLPRGRSHGVRPQDIVGTIAFNADIPGGRLGKITIMDERTFVDIPEEFAGKVLAQSGQYRLQNEKLAIEVSR